MATISGGASFTLVTKQDGTAWAWGVNGAGQLGDGTTTPRVQPGKVRNLSGVTSVSGGGVHGLALAGGTVWSWGDNQSGQLGDGTILRRTEPVMVKDPADPTRPFGGVAAIAAGHAHSMALKTDGTVWAWGDNTSGQLGNGATGVSPLPLQVAGLEEIRAISAKGGRSLAVKADGSVWEWGVFLSNRPVKVSGISQAVSAAAGAAHSLALMQDGTVSAWGRNTEGLLVDGTTKARSGGGQVTGLTGVRAIAAGLNHSMAVKFDGTVWTWGHNFYGQLGNTTNANSLLPVKVGGISGRSVMAAAGSNHTLALVIPGDSAGEPAVDPAPTSLDFGRQSVGIASDAKTLTLTNSGQGDLQVDKVSIDGRDPGDFTLSSDTCTGSVVAPSRSCALRLRFHPRETGPRLATVEIFDNAPGSPQAVPLAGTGTRWTQWETVAAMPKPRGGLTAATAPDGRIFAIGGYTEACPGCTKELVATVEAYDPNTDTWDTRVTDLPEPRSRSAAVTGSDGRIYVIGGERGVSDPVRGQRAEPTNSVFAYDPAVDRWDTVAGMPSPRADPAATLGADGRIYVVGGRTSAGINLASDAVEVLNTRTNTWTRAAPMPTARWALGAETGPDGVIYAVGGLGVRDGVERVTEAYDSGRDSWFSVPPMVANRDTGVETGIGADGRIYAVGPLFTGAGDRDKYGDAEVFGPDAKKWDVLDARLNEIRFESALAVDLKGRIYVIGGDVWSFTGRPTSATVERYTPRPMGRPLPLCSRRSAPPPVEVPNRTEWSRLASMPYAQQYGTGAIAPNGCIYVMGGQNEAHSEHRPGRLEKAHAWDPWTNTWEAIAPMHIPRLFPASAVSADGRIYVMGGDGPVNTFEVYDPATDRWTLLGELPRARVGHAAVSGSDGRIYVLGGTISGSSAAMDAYDPRTGKWEALPPMPSPRSEFGAVTGVDGRIYAVGGGHGQLESAPGEQVYDPATKTWSAIPPMPTSPRFGLGVAAGVDGRIYAIGGRPPFLGGHPGYNAVEAYDPCTLSWEPVRPPLPDPRRDLHAMTGPDTRIYAVGPEMLEAYDVRSPGASPRVVTISHAEPAQEPGQEELTEAIFTLKLSRPWCHPVTVHFSTVPGTATPGEDYEPVSGQVEFEPGAASPLGPVTMAAGETEKTIRVPVLGDTLAESTEHFQVQLIEARGAVIDPSLDAGTGTIVDGANTRGPQPPQASIGDVVVPESFTGDVPATFTVTLSKPSDTGLSVRYATEDGEAVAGEDYVAASGTLTFERGQTARTVDVTVKSDRVEETTENFFVNLTEGAGAVLADATGEAKILDARPGISVGDVSVFEGNTGVTPAVFTVTSNAPEGDLVATDYATRADGATSGEDFAPVHGRLSFALGETAKQVTVDVTGDTDSELDERFSLVASGPVGAALARPVGLGLIRNDDGLAPGAGPMAPLASGLLPGSLPPPQTIPASQSQAQGQSQAQAQAQAHSQVQQQIHAQSQVQMQQQLQSQAQVQGALMVEREKEIQLERGQLGKNDSPAAQSYRASSRKQPASPMPAAMVTWLAAIAAFCISAAKRSAPQAQLETLTTKTRRSPRY